MATHLVIGKAAEEMALQYLQSQHLTLIAKNWRCNYGEIDLIMTDKQSVIFIEVRYRKQTSWGEPAETVTYSKRQKLIKAASLFLQQNNSFSAKPCRFDVIAMTGELKNPAIRWLTNAFSLT
ncbi:YraN family protein [Entomomonas asaccharolytica]|uniref:UPF0102 protein JHT90_08435 n=1 Tax=Entomomonas asaccharolytica TaxID=2785331 RepID=A0A974ND86_9GAMM|nr:YraN family protein [Entomomonas asaccharolytica]QQP84449.1 YraN family protein [Entomomonas asaccharolytica]